MTASRASRYEAGRVVDVVDRAFRGDQAAMDTFLNRSHPLLENAARPDDVSDMPAKFAGLRVSKGDVMAFYGPCGGGYGDPLGRPADKVLEDALDEFCTVEHAREAYGVVVDLDTETIDVAATDALQSRMRADPRRGESSPAAMARRGDGARLEPRAALAASAADRPAIAGSGDRRGAVPTHSVAKQAAPTRAASPAGRPKVEVLVARLNEHLGDDWSFDVQRNHRNGGGIEVTAELKSNGARMQRTDTSNDNGTLPLGAQIEIASEAAFRSCAAEMQAVANRGQTVRTFGADEERPAHVDKPSVAGSKLEPTTTSPCR